MSARMRDFGVVMFFVLAASLCSGQGAPAGALPDACTKLLNDVWINYNNLKSAGIANPAQAIQTGIDALREGNAASCLQSLAESDLGDAATPSVLKPEDIAPARADLLAAITNYSSQAQQGATTSSTSVVSPVSKLLGFSSIAEEFAGVNVSNASNSMTLSLSLQSLLEDLVQQRVLLPCSNSLNVNSGCIKPKLYDFIRGFTPSVTASSSSAIKGTANSTATPTPVTLSTPGSTWPSFGGFGLKGVAWYRNGAANTGTKGSGNANAGVSPLMSSALDVGSLSCPDYDSALKALVTKLSQRASDGESAFAEAFANGYPSLTGAVKACLDENVANSQTFRKWVAEEVISTVADTDASTTPVLGFEYDLSTPLNQPSYSTFKGNFSWQFGKSPAAKNVPQTAAKGGGSPGTPPNTLKSQTIQKQNWVEEVYDTIEGSKSAPVACSNANAGAKTANCKTTLAAGSTKAVAGSDTPPLTINLMVDGEFYNSQPPSSVPSAQRLRDVQVGLEIDYILRGSGSKNWLANFIGDSTLSGSYLYQDQTSPSIVNAPPSGISFSNLPSTATTVYASRGPINLGQIRWGLGTGSNLSFPIAFTYSNRSALIDHPIKGLQFGISYNLSSLFSNNAGSSKAAAAGPAGLN